jgi:hypothetical protein
MIIEFFLGFVGIVFAIAGAALVKFTMPKTSSGSPVNFQEASRLTEDAGSKVKEITRHLYNPKKLNESLDGLGNWMKTYKDRIGAVSKYLMQKEKEFMGKLNMEAAMAAKKYLGPIKEVGGKLGTYLGELTLFDKANQLENAGYIGEKELQIASQDIYRLSTVERIAQGYRAAISNFFEKAKAGFFRKNRH